MPKHSRYLIYLEIGIAQEGIKLSVINREPPLVTHATFNFSSEKFVTFRADLCLFGHLWCYR